MIHEFAYGELTEEWTPVADGLLVARQRGGALAFLLDLKLPIESDDMIVTLPSAAWIVVPGSNDKIRVYGPPSWNGLKFAFEETSS